MNLSRVPGIRGLGIFLLAFLSCGVLSSAHTEYRLVLIKVDGLPPQLMAALAFPEREDFMAQLKYSADLKQAIDFYTRQTGREIVLPNIRKYFYEDGVVFHNMFSETVTLSAAAWALLDTAQPSVIKGHATFSRDTCYLRSHLDGLRDTIDALKRGEGKTAAVWNLDQIGVGLLYDAFDPFRAWTGPQIYRRIGNRDLLVEMGKTWLTNQERGAGDIVRSHLSRLVTGIDYTEFNQEMNAFMTERRILERDLTGKEKYDFISPFFTLMDHQQHVDPHPINLIHWMVKLDHMVGGIFRAVEQSERRDQTIVAMISDHGSEINPGDTAFSFPVTKVFRTREFGGHTVKTLLVESAWNAVTVIVPGIDFPRVYESPFSPYGKKSQHGEDDWVTCYIDPFGNSRASVNLRNNDINRLHLLLLRLKDRPSGERFLKLRELFQETLEQARKWLSEDLRLYEDYSLGAEDLASGLSVMADDYSRDSAWRLRQEFKRDQVQIQSLKRLMSIVFEPGKPGISFDEAFTRDFEISDYIPRQYLGLANSVYQLSNYTIGLDDELNWIQTTVDHRGNPIPMDYYEILSGFRAANAPVNGEANPYDLIVTRIPNEGIERTLVAQKVVGSDESLRSVLWLKSTASRSPLKGGEALLIERKDRQVKYIPVSGFLQDGNGAYGFEQVSDIDPFSFLRSPEFHEQSPEPRLLWMSRFQPIQSWFRAVYETEYGTSLGILLDVFNDPVPDFVDSLEFQKYLVQFTSDSMKQRYLRGLKRKYAAQRPDFIVWCNQLWNFNSKARTSGGSHAGLRPITTRTAFVVWGGDETGIARGLSVNEIGTTLDVGPTLFRAMGMLDRNGRIVRDPASIPERILHPLPGTAHDVFSESVFASRESSGASPASH